MLRDLPARSLGFGCFSLTGAYGKVDEEAAEQVLEHALKRGVQLLDTSDAYAAGRNEELVGRVRRRFAGEALVATKFGWVAGRDGTHLRLDSSPEQVQRSCEASLRRLGVERIDVYLQHRVDPAVPIEETAGAVARLVEQGKVAEFGLSEAAPATVRRAHSALPVAALQTEYSLFWREPERELLPLCKELGIAYIAYSPLGRGLLTGQTGVAAGDARIDHPRFSAANLPRNHALVTGLAGIADRVGCTPGQLALAWLLSRPWRVIPIPGTRTVAHLEENLQAAAVSLSPATIAEIEEVMPPGSGAGQRHTADHLPTMEN